MLHAILNGKTNGVLRPCGDYCGGDDFEGYEDSLTAAVFSRLSYLPTADFFDILGVGVCYGDQGTQLNICLCQKIFGEIVEVKFWPSWKDEEDRFVIPDVFFEFELADLIVEAKRDDYQTAQKSDQIVREVEGYRKYRKAYPKNNNNKELWVLAIGGVASLRNFRWKSPDIKLIVMKWSSLAEKINDLLEKKTCCDGRKRILEDLIEALRIHGIEVRQKFDFVTFTKFASSLEVDKICDINAALGLFLKRYAPECEYLSMMQKYSIDPKSIELLGAELFGKHLRSE
ncbi:hypothetical protein [Methylococcus capsulatus]|uniref:hypothetical protein n=1 Tax=Methylococcus capsulatus TaxID=414 RepID=UPI001C533650|nr:hypothetical protein [Methylococcus capsulatus]QXP90932.1 hypothetical protein KW114_01845 [Methylococcus capsulatus]